MRARIHLLRRRFTTFARETRGGASMEFVLIFPAIVFFVFAYVEIGSLTTRAVLLERGLDLAIRDVRLGVIPNNLDDDATHELIKDRVCNGAFLLGDCRNALFLEMTPVPLGSDLPNRPVRCVDRTGLVQPVVSINLGDRSQADQQLMLVRACIVIDPIFPGSGIGAGLAAVDGGYALMAQTAFLNEPSD